MPSLDALKLELYPLGFSSSLPGNFWCALEITCGDVVHPLIFMSTMTGGGGRGFSPSGL